MAPMIREAFDDANLIEFSLANWEFNWSNRHYGNNGIGFIQLNIDKVMANANWRMLFPNAFAKALLETSLDHKLIVVYLCEDSHFVPRHFRFEAILALDHRIFWVVQQAWLASHLS